MQHFDFELAPNGAREIQVHGSYVYYLAGSAGGADDTIVLKNIEGSDEVILRPGQSFDLGGGKEYVRWNVSNYKKQGTIIGRLLMGVGRFDDNRITGSVEVIDGGKNRTMAGQSFIGRADITPVAGQYNHVQLWNPAGSGKNVILKRVRINNGTTAQAFIVRIGAALVLANLAGNMHSKLLNGVASSAQLRTETSAVALGGASIISEFMAANGVADIILHEPIVLLPGSGMIVQAGTAATNIPTTFETVEEGI